MTPDEPESGEGETPRHEVIGPEASGPQFYQWRAAYEPIGPEPAADAPYDLLLAALGNPPGWDGAASLHERLLPAYRAAVRGARTLLRRGG